MEKGEERKCLECGTRLRGRIDKRFCSDQCRITYNNRRNSDATNMVRNVNNKLRKNRRILVELNTLGKTKVTRERMLEKGFDFNYITSSYTTRQGAVYRYCYDQGYLEVDRNLILLVVNKRSG